VYGFSCQNVIFIPFADCQFGLSFGVLKELDEIIAIPKKRSVKISWQYDFDPEDTGLVIQIPGASQDKITFNLTAREYVFHGLGNYNLYIALYLLVISKLTGQIRSTYIYMTYS
jgi:hypothetical protein